MRSTFRTALALDKSARERQRRHRNHVIARFGGRLATAALVVALAGCGSSTSTASSDECDAGAIGRAIDTAAASGDAPAKRCFQLDDIAASITQCEASSATASTDRKDPLNLQLARANLAAGKAYTLAGDKPDARQDLAGAAFTAKFIGDVGLESDATAALKALR